MNGIARPASSTPHVHKRVQSPVGLLTLVASDEGLAAVLWQDDRPGRVRIDIGAEVSEHPVLCEAEWQLAEYFNGRRRQFALPLEMSGTPFQRRVWSALLAIPFGETRSYRDIAGQIGTPRAVRAVGAANGRNPLSIVAPCHRVIGSTGALTGFAGGVAVKARLLDFERDAAASQPALVPPTEIRGIPAPARDWHRRTTDSVCTSAPAREPGKSD